MMLCAVSRHATSTMEPKGACLLDPEENIFVDESFYSLEEAIFVPPKWEMVERIPRYRVLRRFNLGCVHHVNITERTR